MIRVQNISKTYKLYQKPADRLREVFFKQTCHKDFHALRDISFVVRDGESLGVIGQNGAGKSTLLKIMTGVVIPDCGLIERSGRITGLLELGTGFNPEFTGVENIYLNATYLVLNKAQIDERLDAIIDFSELGDFINEPLKTYSSGMAMRLGFAVAYHADPEVFLVDEALSVGDAYFQQKCMRTIRRFKSNGGSLVFVSHDMNAVKLLCDRVVLLEHGVVVDDGPPEQVINTYNFMLAKKKKKQDVEVLEAQGEAHSFGNGKVLIAEAYVCDAAGEKCDTVISGLPYAIRVVLQARETVGEMTVGILFRDRFGQDIFGTNTHLLGQPLRIEAGQTRELYYRFDQFNVGPGKYTLTVAAHTQDTHVDDCYNWIDRVHRFQVVGGSDFQFIGLNRLVPRIEWQENG